MSEDQTVAIAPPADRQDSALQIVKNHMAISAGVGLIPIPLVDVAGIAGVQLSMLYKISKAYDVPFTANLAKSLVSSLLGCVLPTNAAWGATGTWVKAIPVIGPFVGWATMPALAAATTYAVGRVFIEHFESGGTFLTFNPKTAQAQMQKHMRDAAKEDLVSSAEPAGEAKSA